MEYKNIVKDFADRTVANLELFEKLKNNKQAEIYEVTQLINSLMGLIIVSKEKKLEHIPNISFQRLEEEGWNLPSILLNKFSVNNLRQLVRVLRNAFAHFNLEVISDENGNISGLKVCNKNRRNRLTFIAKFDLAQLRSFVEKYHFILKQL